MRVGFNPHKDVCVEDSTYFHQVIIPVFIPNQKDYFRDSFEILKICLKSLFETIHKRTFITIVNNGSCNEIRDYLTELYENSKINEIIHTENIGKLNAILKGIVGNNIELVTIADSDVLFLEGWQDETAKIFKSVDKAGVVGLTPQFKMYESYCGNIIFDNLFNSNLKFLPVKNSEALIKFYDSLGWKRDYNSDYLRYALGLIINSDLNVLIGSGHFVATYKKDIFNEIKSFIGFKMGGDSETYLDKLLLHKNYWRLTTYDNYAYHMGNTVEDWMSKINVLKSDAEILHSNFSKSEKQSKLVYFIKNRLFVKFLSFKWILKMFLRYKDLPHPMIKNY